MKYIIKNCKSETNFGMNVYTICNDKTETYAEVELTPEKAIELSSVLGIVSVSPMYAFRRGMLHYKKIEL